MLELVVNGEKPFHSSHIIEILKIVCRGILEFVVVLKNFDIMAQGSIGFVVPIDVVLRLHVQYFFIHLKVSFDLGRYFWIHCTLCLDIV